MASMYGHLGVVRLLLENKVDVNMADRVPAPTATRSPAFSSAANRHYIHYPNSHIARPFGP